MQLILAADENWGIGKDGDLLCHIPGDLKFFKEKTLGKTVVMGRTTLESLPGGRPLPKRENIVITSKKDLTVEGALVVHSEAELMDVIAGKNGDDVVIIGGAMVYKEFLDRCDTCYITKIYKKFDADRFFTDLDQDPGFQVVWESDVQEENGIRYQWFEYKRK